MDVTHKTPVAILISGRGTNMMALVKAAQSGQLDADIRLVLSNKADAPGLQFAKQMNIPTKVLSHRDFPDRESFDKALVEAVEASGAQVVVLAGFMRVLTSTFLSKFPNRVLNIHPALLPSFPGMHAQRQAIEYGVKIAGCTVHIVDEGTDTGPILAQAALEVLKDDDENSLSARILELENRLYPSALQTFIAANAAKRLATGKE
jgi:phosphoribosylglycinamide formyltransferase-1